MERVGDGSLSRENTNSDVLLKRRNQEKCDQAQTNSTHAATPPFFPERADDVHQP
jgi:hypothetical protein